MNFLHHDDIGTINNIADDTETPASSPQVYLTYKADFTQSQIVKK